MKLAALLLLAFAGTAVAQDGPLMTCQMVDADRNLVTFEVEPLGELTVALNILETGQTFTALIQLHGPDSPGGAAIISDPSATGEVLIGQLRADGALGMIYANPTDANRTRYLGNCEGYQAALDLWNDPEGDE